MIAKYKFMENCMHAPRDRKDNIFNKHNCVWRLTF